MTGQELVRKLYHAGLDSSHYVVCVTAEGKTSVLAETNFNGGLCDDCSNREFLTAEIATYKIYQHVTAHEAREIHPAEVLEETTQA